MSTSSAADQLRLAVRGLELARGQMKDRLQEVAKYLVAAVRDSSQDLRFEFGSIWPTRVPPDADETAVRAVISQMSEEAACDIAIRIFGLAYKVRGASKQAFEDEVKALAERLSQGKTRRAVSLVSYPIRSFG
jgi:hypothetical protein